jgi:pyruvate dehydrogenase complex dihydrolipoamide acetyltransferase long form
MREVFRLPDVGEGIAHAEIVEYLVKVGDKVKADQIVVRIETDKAVVELPSPFEGTVLEIPHNPGDTVSVGDPLVFIETDGVAATPVPPKHEPEAVPTVPEVAKPAAATPTVARTTAEEVLATPHTRKLARELKVDINTVKGTGPHSRVTDEDVKRAATQVPAPAPKAPTAAAVQAPATSGFDFEKYGPTRRVPLKGVRKRVAEVMVRSVSTIPHVTHFDETDVTDLLKVLEAERAFAESRNVKLTIVAFLAKASAAALKRFPALNSSLDEETGEIVYKEYVHIGIATDTEAGLMVPVIRDVDRKSVLEIAADLQSLAAKSRDRSIDLEDLRGGTFTISNVGAIGGMWATPIILHPQVAILGVLRTAKKPVVIGDEIVVRTMMPMALSFDHRVLDGAEAARFMNHIKELISDPLRMLVDVG